MYQILVVVQVVLAVSLIGLILIQHGKGADAGAAFGSGASGTVFGSQGAATFLTRMTGTLATLFFLVSLGLAVLVARGAAEGQSVIDKVEEPAAPATMLPEEDSPAQEPLAPPSES